MIDHMKCRKQGTVESYEHIYEPLKQLGVPARVWDEVLDEMFHEPLETLALHFRNSLFDLEVVARKGRRIIPVRMASATTILCATFLNKL